MGCRPGKGNHANKRHRRQCPQMGRYLANSLITDRFALGAQLQEIRCGAVLKRFERCIERRLIDRDVEEPLSNLVRVKRISKQFCVVDRLLNGRHEFRTLPDSRWNRRGDLVFYPQLRDRYPASIPPFAATKTRLHARALVYSTPRAEPHPQPRAIDFPQSLGHSADPPTSPRHPIFPSSTNCSM